METQQMIELLLARMDASIKQHVQEMTARMETNQAKWNADMKSMLEKMAANQAKADADMKSW
jgi:hypothetical protein